jgi:hypothetical protein
MTWAPRLAVLLVALTGVCSATSGADDPVIDADVRSAISGGTVRVLVDLRASSTDPPAIGNLQDEALRRLAGTGARVVRRFATVPLLALAIDASALTRATSSCAFAQIGSRHSTKTARRAADAPGDRRVGTLAAKASRAGRHETLLFMGVANGTLVAHYNGPCGLGHVHQFP